ncbi:hypothetical protein [Pseudomonas sp. NPDC099000]|uniref:hypothetical protein n=1 Tax=Pseudomonas sp. NPDC099000 TaxID=3364488 RepID=UPI003839D20A
MELRTIFFAAFVWLPCANAAEQPRPIEGDYYLYGAMEMAARLVLKKDGSFAAAAAYGSANGTAMGTWSIESNKLKLTSEADPHAAKKLVFEMPRTRNLAELEESYRIQHGNYDEIDNDTANYAQTHYILQMQYDRHPPPPAIDPVYLYFEFSEGAGSQQLLESNETTDLWLPYDPQRTLTRIGFGTSRNSGPIQWFDVSPDSRWFGIGWKKEKSQPIAFSPRKEKVLAEIQRDLNDDEQGRILKNYLITVYHFDPISTPAISPVDVYWRFDDGSTEQQVWADSKQERLSLPYSPTRTLEKIGLHTQGSKDEIEWLPTLPDMRWMRVDWKDYTVPANGELSLLFQDLRLAIEPDCLAVDFGNGKACFRRR